MRETADALPAAPLLVVGDALLDRDLVGACDRLAPGPRVPVVADCEERLRPGGAALAAYLAARDGREVTLVTALGEDDPPSRRLRELLAPWVTLVSLPLTGELGERTRILDRDQPVVRLDRGTGRAAGATEVSRAAIASAGAVLVADCGRGVADAVREAVAARAREVPVVWDPDSRGLPPVAGARLAVPSDAEARHFAAALPSTAHCRELRSVGQRAQALVHAWQVSATVVTLGPRGVLLSFGDGPVLMPAARRFGGDSCGSGDQFAATVAGLLADGVPVEEAVRGAVAAATDFVVDGGARALDFLADAARQPTERDVQQLVDQVRADDADAPHPDTPHPDTSPTVDTPAVDSDVGGDAVTVVG